MEPANSERFLVRALKEIADESGIEINTFSQDWIIELKKNNRTGYVFGYNFDLNAAASYAIVNDKSAAAELLIHNGIPAVKHQLFLHPKLSGYIASRGNWSEMLSYFQEHKSDIICKANTGTGGNQVYRVQTPLELERSVHKLFSSNRGIAFSPYIDIKSEFRLVMLGDACELAYEKIRPSVLGDGHSTISELIAKNFLDVRLAENLTVKLSKEKENSELLSSIPQKDELIVLSWKHNLGQGARASEIKDETLKNTLINLALSCLKIFNLDFVSVDMVHTGNEFLVMEINSGVMMEFYSRQGEAEYEKAKQIYSKAVMKMLS